jgi:TolB-like protein/DNA-binding winged helix-turn-helix (wHTH) protein/Tfp pilus assembly protein PilF
MTQSLTARIEVLVLDSSSGGSMPKALPAERVRFGIFEVDVRSGELYKRGRRLRLHQQPFQVLTLLIEHQGEVVTREELRRKLWPSDTFVNFDIGLNSAVRKLRAALNDSAESPRYVETLPRRGYRFIAPVELASDSNGESESPIRGAESWKSAEDAAQQAAPPVSPWERRRWMTWSLYPVAFALVISAATWPDVRNRFRGSIAEPTPIRIRSLAVLPLENLSGDPKQDYLADGMTEDLTTNLGQIGSLKVIARRSVTHYKGTDKRLAEIARELSVDGFVTGSVILSRDRLRVDVQLVEAATGRQVWSQTYDQAQGDMIGLQGEITRAVAHEIQATLTPEQQAHLLRQQSVDQQTYELYVWGRSLWAKKLSDEDDSVQRSIQYFTQAIQRQPNFAPAYAALAEVYDGASYIPPKQRFSEAKAAAYKALQLDNTLPEAHSALAMSLFLYDWNWGEAEREFQRAIALNPNYAPAHQFYGQFLKAMGRKNWADEVKRAAELDPVPTWFAGGGWYLDAGEYDKYIDLQKKKLELDPNSSGLWVQLGHGYTLKGEYPAAIESLKKGVTLSAGASSSALTQLGYAYGLAGRRADALDVLGQMERLSKRRYVHPTQMAIVNASIGRKDRAFEWLSQAYVDHDNSLVFLNRPGEMDSLRSDPRFAELKRRIGLPE